MTQVLQTPGLGIKPLHIDVEAKDGVSQCFLGYFVLSRPTGICKVMGHPFPVERKGNRSEFSFSGTLRVSTVV